MARRARRAMSVEAFVACQQRQDRLHELVEGVPVPPCEDDDGGQRPAGPGHRQHHRRPSWPAARTGIAPLRRPDVTVECGDLIPDSYESRTPRLVVEVLSPSTSTLDRFRKLEEYKRHPTIAYIQLGETRWPSATLYRRDGETWDTQAFETVDAEVDLPAIAATLSLVDIYDGMTFVGLREAPIA